MRRSERLAAEIDAAEKKLATIKGELVPLARERASLQRRLRRLRSEYAKALQTEGSNLKST